MTLASDQAEGITSRIRNNVNAGTPFGSAESDVQTEPGSDGIEPVPADTEDAYTCGECGTSWLEDTPAGRCPWEAEHGEELTGMDYLEDVLDIQYVVNSQREYLHARILIGYGGPNVWIDTADRQLQVYWDATAIETLPAAFIDGLDEALSELWEMGA